MTVFDAMVMAPWLLGAVAVASIWGCLWWLLSVIGYPPHVQHPSAAPTHAESDRR